MARHLAAVTFPARAEELAAGAEAADAPPEMVAALRDLPGDEEHVNGQSVWQALGGAVEQPHLR